jgi:3',5'-cyclic AMP phosphodiesterase CpdA
MSLTRRRFLGTSAAGAAAALLRIPRIPGLERLSFGLCADVHQDLMHDAVERMQAFVAAMDARQVDFVVQLGDFCTPRPQNRRFVDAFHAFRGPHHHVRGNHDTDGGFTVDQVRAFWAIDATSYDFVQGGVRFVVLDGNQRHDGAPPGYPRHVGAAQRAWLAERLALDAGPVVVFSHQSLEHPDGVDDGAAVREILESAERRAGRRRVLACFSGHHHLDALVEVGGIPYVQLNSMSYYWVGAKHRHASYPAHIHDAHPHIGSTMPYRDPLWATVTIDPEAGELRIEGRQSAWVGPGPEELGLPEAAVRQGIRPAVGDRRVPLA